jgi:hypothetical protein
MPMPWPRAEENAQRMVAVALSLLQFYGLALNAPGSPPRPSAPAVAAAAAATVTPVVAALVRGCFRQSHQIHWTGGLHGY